MKDSNYQPHYANSWALVIGINNYVHGSPLDIACADAESVAKVLTEDLGFPNANVMTLLDEDATRDQIMERFLAFERLGPDDRLFVFFAGHGATVDGYRGPVGYLVPVDGKCDDKSGLIRWEELTRSADIIPAKHILFVMDACYSGLAIQRASSIGEKRFVRNMLQRRSRQVITAGKADEKVADGGGPTGKNSIFTGYLLEGLRGKAANEDGVLTASYLMNYVYQKVSNDSRSEQSPHFGHLDGDGDFILRTPEAGQLSEVAAADFLVKPIVERPEQPAAIPTISIKPRFAEKNGYADPESDKFGRNEWSRKLGTFHYRSDSQQTIIRPSFWLSLVVEPISNPAINLDILSLAKTLPNQTQQSDRPYEQFKMPALSATIAKSVILFDQDQGTGHTNDDCWKRFLRIEKTGAIEYCSFEGVARSYSTQKLAVGINVFFYVQLIGVIWSFIYAAKRILSLADYHAGVRYLVNLIGTKDSVLVQFSSKPGKEEKTWRQPFDNGAWSDGSEMSWKCRDANLQIPFEFVLGSFREVDAKKLIVECAEQLGLAYNHKSTPRCFNYGTDLFPWEQFSPHHG